VLESGSVFILSQKIKGQGHESQKNIASVIFCTLVSDGLF